MNELYVGNGVRVTLNFELRLDSGEVVDSTYAGRPGSFEFGDGTLPAGIETLIRGLRVGEGKCVEVSPEQGFGMPNPNNLQRFKRQDFKALDGLEVGMVMSFADAAKAELPGIIRRVDGDEIEVDFNHPLAGRQLHFEVEIIDLERLDGSESGETDAD